MKRLDVISKRVGLMLICLFSLLKANATTYISDVKIGGGSETRSTSYNRAANGGYTVIDRDLNEKAGGDYIFLSYKTTTDYTKAITRLLIMVGKEYGDKKYLTTPLSVGGEPFYLAPYENDDADYGDLNNGASGKYLYLYYSRDYSFASGKCVQSLSIDSEASSSVGYYDGTRSYYDGMDLNKGAGGSTLYLHTNMSDCLHNVYNGGYCLYCGIWYCQNHTFAEGDNCECTTCHRCFIHYTSTDGNIVNHQNGSSPFTDASVISNTYTNGEGILELDRMPTTFMEQSYINCTTLSSYTIPKTVTTIGLYTFDGSGLSGDLTIPESVTSIGGFAFSSCFGLTGTLTITNPNTVFGLHAFYNNNFNRIVLPENLKAIGTVDDEADMIFYCSDRLQELNLPQGLETIGYSAFKSCGGLTKLTIPSSVKTISHKAFYDCKNLHEINCECETPPVLSGDAQFDELPSDFRIYVPLDKVETYINDTSWSKYKDHIVLYGDVDGNGKVEYMDTSCYLVLLLLHNGDMKEYVDLCGYNYYNSDINRDGKISLSDYTWLFKILQNKSKK